MHKKSKGPRKGKIKGLTHATPTIKKTIKQQFRKQIKEYEAYHKEDALKWSAKQPWEQWQDEFEQKVKNPPSYYLYANIQDFAEEKSKGDSNKERWILKSIGPKPKKEIPWQGDWALERAFNKSNESVAVRKLEEKIKQDDDIRKLTLPVAAGLEDWRLDVDSVRMRVMEVLGGNVIEHRPEKFKNKLRKHEWEARQRERLDWYQTWMERLFAYKEKVDALYLKALGADIFTKNSAQMELAMERIMKLRGLASASQPTGEGDKDQSFLQVDIWRQAITQEIAKSNSFDMELPAEYKDLAKDLAKKKIIPAEAIPISKDE